MNRITKIVFPYIRLASLSISSLALGHRIRSEAYTAVSASRSSLGNKILNSQFTIFNQRLNASLKIQ